MHIEIALTSLAPRRAEGQIMFTCVELQDDPGSREQRKARIVGRLEQRAFELAGGYIVAVGRDLSRVRSVNVYRCTSHRTICEIAGHRSWVNTSEWTIKGLRAG